MKSNLNNDLFFRYVRAVCNSSDVQRKHIVLDFSRLSIKLNLYRARRCRAFSCAMSFDSRSSNDAFRACLQHARQTICMFDNRVS